MVRGQTRTASVVYARDEHGVSYAIEVIDAATWDKRFLVPPAADEADVRVVRLRAVAPSTAEVLPPWLHVEQVLRRVAEDAAVYAAGVAGAPGVEGGGARTISERLWAWSSHHRGPGPALVEFIASGAIAVLHPQPVPAESHRQLDVALAFAADRTGPLGVLARLGVAADTASATPESDAQASDAALERWLQQAFVEPDRFADAILIERIADLGRGGTRGAAEVAEVLLFLRDAVIDEEAAEYLELAIDRRALLEQASPWRYVEGVPFGGALAAVRAWRERYRLAYEAQYRSVLREARVVSGDLDAARRTAEALARLNEVAALGPAVGAGALREYYEACVGIEVLPAAPAAARARTAGITLGTRPAQFERAGAAIEAVRVAFEQQRDLLAARTAHLVLSRQDVPALDRLLQVIGASDLDGIDRVLDDRLVALITELLTAGDGSE